MRAPKRIERPGDVRRTFGLADRKALDGHDFAAGCLAQQGAAECGERCGKAFPIAWCRQLQGQAHAFGARRDAGFEHRVHFYQPGFSRQDWNNWFAAGAGKSGASGVASTLRYIRSYATDQQVPTSRHSVFLRANWVDAFVPYLNLTR